MKVKLHNGISLSCINNNFSLGHTMVACGVWVVCILLLPWWHIASKHICMEGLETDHVVFLKALKAHF